MAKKSRGAQGRGSIYKRASDGKWVGSVDLGVIDGKRRRKSYYGDTEKEVVAKLDAALALVRQGKPLTNERRTVADFMEHWFTVTLPMRVKDGKIRPITADDYVYMMRRYVLPTLGRRAIAKVTTGDVESLMHALSEATDSRRALGSRSRKRVRVVLHKAMKDAKRLGYITHNPVSDTEPIPKSHRVEDALTVAEAEALLTAAKGDRLEALVTVGLMLGLRKGEELALRWEHIDFDAGTLRVEGTLRRRIGAKKGVEGAGLTVNKPKTESSRRVVHLPDVVLAALREHKERQTEEARKRLDSGRPWQLSGHVFTTTIGSPLDPAYAHRKYHAITKRAGLGARRFHALRHSAATLMLAAGVPITTISAILGHSGISITSDLYAAVGMELKKDGAAAMDRMFGRQAN